MRAIICIICYTLLTQLLPLLVSKPLNPLLERQASYGRISLSASCTLSSTEINHHLGGGLKVGHTLPLPLWLFLQLRGRSCCQQKRYQFAGDGNAKSTDFKKQDGEGPGVSAPASAKAARASSPARSSGGHLPTGSCLSLRSLRLL